jgi:G:T-mismatch repair DNA endonuclease (very short patch repair protein)
MLDLRHTKTVRVFWNSTKNIARAEREKARLENAGWVLINQFGGLNESALVYAKHGCKGAVVVLPT